MGSGRNMLVEGEWTTDVVDETAEDGAFERDESTFRSWVKPNQSATFPAEPDRYHLYVSRSCPWAHRTVLARRFNGLEDAISMDIVDPYREDDGWEFSPDKPGCTLDTANGTAYLRDVYLKADPEYTGRVTVPVLWDKRRETVVNNESAEILRMFDTAFDAFGDGGVDLYPRGYRDEVDRIIDAIYEPINDGVYRAGFADNQAAYETAVAELFEALDTWEAVLADQRYLCGPVFTEADVCLFTTLVRFDLVYHTHFKCNVRRIVDYPNLWNYLKDVYQLRGVAETVVVDHIKAGYYREHVDLNPTQIIPAGPAVDFTAAHDRARLPGGPPESLRA